MTIRWAARGSRTITKRDAAERQIIAAVQLLFDDGDPIPVCTSAHAARMIVTMRGAGTPFDF
jgi:hypothetical protein